MAVRNRLTILILVGALAATARSVRAESVAAESAKVAAPNGASESGDQPASLQEAVSQLLRVGKSYSPGALAEAHRQHQRLEKMPGYDAWARYAFSLVLIKHRSFDDAITTLDELVASQPDLLPAWRAKIWTEMAVRKHRAAVDDMRTAAALIGRQAAESPTAADSEDQRATAFLMGRAFGFLEAERTGAISTSDLRRSKQNVLSKLGELRSAFVAGEEAFSVDLSQAAEAINKAEAAAALEHEQAEQALKLRQTAVDKAGAKVEYETEKLKTQVKHDLDELGKEAEALQKELLKGQFALNTVDEGIGILQQRMVVENQARRWRGIDARETGRAQTGLRRFMAQRTVIARQMAELSYRLNDVAMRTQALLAQSSENVGQLQTKSDQLQHQEKKFQYAEKLRPKNKQSTNQQSRALRQQKQSFRSYEPFPFEQQRQRVLAALQSA